ncbi:hypothetical protein [Cytophaga hutchinsonii]|uniref:Uncharacterized protein n=1 Tax=Cytophaga hutchinsonii (strain ATCC 33406 / DSM 1761 / CIP 103989 / NBRC 15051 / NCIMB 9469 / D465) TaxID=269798 RepID=A0A6N4SRH0_CYTH3|nr:hypothetical protein [Cytophaga hutchinsonii]ABG58937.1 conserved hypothetical protein [Cytophaga hutchinsonii ATCC 33406]SFX82392.1 hypothetical protein SAMN04487930_110138 [Cytophaga hutchinsonii ATCC 33406]
MAKVAKKSASSAKKSVATKKVVAKKADKQKKTAVKVTTTASKKKVAAKPAAKKVAPVAKKKVVAKKATKPVAPAKKAPAAKKPVAKKVAVKAPAKPVAKAAKVVEIKKAAKNVPVAKKAVAAAKAKPAAPVAKKAVPEKTVKIAAPAAKAEVKKEAPVLPAAALAGKVAAKPRRKKKKNDDDDDDEEEVVFRKPVKTAKTSAVKKASSKYISEELTMEGPAPKRVGQITMTSDEKIKLKKALLNKCIDIQKNTVAIAKKAMEDALTSANAEKVTEELSDSFRESMHATRDMYARQANEGVNNLGLLNRINIVEHDKVKFGSVVFTNFQNYFISTGLGEIKVEDLSFQAVSTLAPLFQILVDKKKGDTFMFLDRLYTVIEVF